MTVTETKLKNGLRIITNEMPDIQTTSMGVYIGSGARAETKEINGIAHLIEHMMFKGTEKRNAKDLVEAIENVGGSINAYTSRESTVYHTKTLTQDLTIASDVLSDMVQNSVLDEKELASEQNVVIQEISQSNDTPDDVVFDYFQEAIFGDHPLGRTILGPAETIPTLDQGKLKNFINQNYVTSNIIISGAGKLKHGDFVSMIEGHFDHLPQGSKPQIQQASYQGAIRKVERDIEQLHVVYGLPSVNYFDPFYHTSLILSGILGGSMSSRLFQEVREKRGLAYSIYSFTNTFVDTGVFGIYAASNADKAGEIIQVIQEEILKLPTTLETVEIDRAKTQIIASLLMSQESSMSRCEQLGHQMLIHGRPIPIEEYVTKLKAVSKDHLIEFAKRLISTPNPTLAALGPEKAVGHKALTAAPLA